MIKTDTVARFSLIFARKVHFSENSSVRENFRQNLAEASSDPLHSLLKREPCTAGGELALAASTALPPQ